MISNKRLEELKSEANKKLAMEFSRMVAVHPAELLNLIKEIQQLRDAQRNFEHEASSQ